MKLVELNTIFDIPATQPKIKQKEAVQVFNVKGVNYVAAITANNGVKMLVRRQAEIKKGKKGAITVPIDGHAIFCAFLQNAEFYCSELVRVLYPKDESMCDEEKLFYCICIRKNKFKFGYGNKPNKELEHIKIPARSKLPSWLYSDKKERKATMLDILQATKIGFIDSE